MLNIWLDAVIDLINVSTNLNESIDDESLVFHIDGEDYYVNKSSFTNTGEIRCRDGMNGDYGYCGNLSLFY